MAHFAIYLAICIAYCEAALQSVRKGWIHEALREIAISLLYGMIAIFSLDQPLLVSFFSPLVV